LNDKNKTAASILAIHDFKNSCKHCSLNALCLPLALELSEVEELEKIVQRSKPIGRNRQIYMEGDQFSSIYVVRSGSVKVFTTDDDGDEHVIGFFFPGEIFGLESIDGASYSSDAVAMETSSVCELPFDRLNAIASRIPVLQARIYRILSSEIRKDQQLQMLLGKTKVEERIGTFLLNLSERHKRRKLSPDIFRLSMTRQDIANYLGVAVETVSRTFSRLQKDNIVSVDKRELQILDRERLAGVANHDVKLYG
jgi:CRP/FNR family transcriptional regulator